MVGRASLALLSLFVTSQALAAPDVRLNDRVFRVYYQDAPTQTLFLAPAVERLTTDVAFYNYSSASSHTGFEKAGRSLFFLFRDVRAGQPDAVSLIITQGIDNPPGGQGTAAITLTVTGVPAAASVKESDDAGELVEQANGNFVGTWSFADNTDGGVIGPIQTASAWTSPICIKRDSWSGQLNQWQYYFGGTNDFTLDPNRTVCIAYAGPTPGTISVQENTAVTVCGYFTDTVSTGSYTLDWDDAEEPTAVETGGLSANSVKCWTHTYTNDGTAQATLTVTSTTGTDNAAITINVSNRPPVVTTPPDATVPHGTIYGYTLIATDVPADLPLAFTLTKAPEGMTISSAGVISWQTDVADVGAHEVCVDVNDGTTTVAVCWDLTVPARCDDGAKNGAETDVDCGGGCGPCDRGEGCLVAGDCQPGFSCLDGACGRPCNTEVFLGSQSFVAFYQDAPDDILFVAPAVERLESAASFYDFTSDSSHTGFEKAGRSLFFLYRDVTPGAPNALALILTHGADDPPLGPGGQGTATMDMLITGVPAPAYVAVTDDPAATQGIDELTERADGTFVGDWGFGSNTDGGVIAGIPTDAPWTICLQRTAWTGLTQWQYYFGTDSFDLDPNRTVCIGYRGGDGAATLEGPEGTEVTLCGFATDPDDAEVELSLDWADPLDPTAIDTVTVQPGVVTCWSHTYQDDTAVLATLTAVSDSGYCSKIEEIAVTVDNVPPSPSRPDDATLVPGVPYEVTVTATDPGDDLPLAFAKASGPDGLTVTDGAVSWTPGVAEVGPHEVCVSVSDDVDTVETCWTLTVRASCDEAGAQVPGATCTATAGGCGTWRCTAVGAATCDYGGGPLTDTTCDGVDDDCSGAADEDYAPVATTCGVGACAGTIGATSCVAGGVVDGCDPFAKATAEACDGVDEDCDGTPDDGVCPALETRITSGPEAWTSDTAATFTYDNPLVPEHTDFECSVDGYEWVECDGGTLTVELLDGNHTIRVRATRGDGAVDETPAIWEWLIDTAPPETVIVTGPTGPVQGGEVTIEFGTDNGEGAIYYCVLDPDSDPPAPEEYVECEPETTFSDLAEGEHSVWVYVVDGKGDADPTPVEVTWTVDFTSPDTDIIASPPSPNASGSATFTFDSDDTGVTSFECRLDGGQWAACDTGSATFTGLAEGEHTFEVRAVDPAGLADPSPATVTWTVDTTAPNTTIVPHPDDPSADTSPTFSFGSNENGATFRCRLDGGLWSACAPTTTLDLTDGEHVLEVAAVDEAGNTDPTPATYTWTVDTSAPDTELTTVPSALVGSGSDATFAYEEVNDATVTTFECSLDGGEWVACDGGSYTWDAGELEVGEHTFAVRACDPESPAEVRCDPVPATTAFTVTTSPCPNDNDAPVLDCAEDLTLECVSGGATIDLTTLRPGATDACGEVALTTDATTTAPLGDTAIVFRAEDGNGNVASCSTTVTVRDTTAPSITCPEALVLDAPADACDAALEVASATATDGCGAATTAHDAPARLAVGVGTVTHTATDTAGLTATCAQAVTVRDVTAPTAACGLPEAVAVPFSATATGADACGATVEVRGLTCTRVAGDTREAAACDAVVNDLTVSLAEAPVGADLELAWTVRATDPSGNETDTPCAVVIPGLPEPVDTGYTARGGGGCAGGAPVGLLAGLAFMFAYILRRRRA